MGEEDLDISTLNINGKEEVDVEDIQKVESTIQDSNDDPKVEPKDKEMLKIEATEDHQDENTNPKSENLPKTPKVSTPIGKGKMGKGGQLHPDDVESPRRVTRNLLAKLGPKI